MTISVGSVAVDVVPSAKSFGSLLRQQILPDADRIGKEIGSSLADGIARGFKEGVTSVRTDIDRLKGDLDRLGQQSPSIKVDLDAAKTKAEIDVLEAKVNRLDRDKVNIKVDADTAGAQTKLAALGAAAASAGGGGGLGALVVAGIALGPAIIPVAAAAVAAIAAIGTAAVGAGAGLGVLFLGIKPIIGAVQALSAADASSAADAQAAGAAARSKANAIASANAQVTSSENSLANTRASVASAAVNAGQQVQAAEIALGNTRDTVAAAAVSAAQRTADARRSLGDAEVAAAASIQNALDSVANAERGVESAQDAELKAQQALTDARKSAQQQLEDYQNQLKDGALSERAAVLAIEKAKQNLGNVNRNAGSTQLQRDEAQLAYDQAVQHKVDLDVREQRLKATAAAAAKAGVDGSKQVLAAQDNVTQAAERTAAAEATLSKARLNVAAVEAKAAESVAKAREGVTTAQRAQVDQARQGAAQIAASEQAIGNAVRAQADQQRQGAASIVAAQQSVENAQRSLAAAYAQTNTAGQTTANNLAKAFAGLTPIGAGFARFIYSLKDSFTGLSKAAQDGLLPGLQTLIEALLPSIPALTQFVGNLAKVMGDLFVQASKALTGPFWTQFFDFIGKNAGGWLVMLVQTFGQLIKGAAGLFQALAPVGDLFNGALLRGATAFADFATTLGTNTGFQTFLGYIKDNLPLVLQFLGDLFRAFGNILVALAPLGPVILRVLDGIVRFIAAMDPSQLRLFLLAIGAVALAFAGVPGIIVLVVGALALAYNQFDGFRRLVDLVAGVIVNAYQQFPILRKAVEDAWQGVLNATHPLVDFFITRVVPAVAGIIDAIGGFLKVALPIVVAFVDGMRARIEPLMPQIRAIFGTIGDIIIAALDLIKGVIEFVTKAISFIWTNFGAGILDTIKVVFGAFLGIIQPALDVIKGVIKFFADLLRGNWSALWQDVQDIVSGAFRLLKGILDGGLAIAQQVLSTAWSVITTVAAGAWQGVVDTIGAIWSKLSGVLAGPINTFQNIVKSAFVDPINSMLKAILGDGAFQIPFTVTPVAVSDATNALGRQAARLASGGHVGGYSPHDRADNIPAWLTAGEFVLPVAATNAIRAKGGDGMLEALRQGQIDGSDVLGHADGGLIQRYADGGSVFDTIKSTIGNVGSAVISGAKDFGSFLTDPVGKIKELVTGLLQGLGGTNQFAQAGVQALGRVGDGLGAKVLGLLGAQSAATGGGAGLGTAVDAGGGRVSIGGHLLDATTAGIFEKASAIVGGLNLLQGSWSTSVAASFGPAGSTHGGSGAMDVTPVNGDWNHAVDVIRSLGGIAWHRKPFQGPWADHIHSITPGIPGLSPSAQAQVGNFHAGLDGLVSNGPDNHGYCCGGPVKPLLFDAGGYLPTGISMVQNNTGRPEPLRRVDGEGGPMSMTGTLSVAGDGLSVLIQGVVQRAQDQQAREVMAGVL